jgi:hypothetical protein
MISGEKTEVKEVAMMQELLLSHFNPRLGNKSRAGSNRMLSAPRFDLWHLVSSSSGEPSPEAPAPSSLNA